MGAERLEELLNDLRNADPLGRIRAIDRLAEMSNIPARAFLEVVCHLDDKGEWDPNPGSSDLVKYAPTVASTCKERLPGIALASPATVWDVIRGYAALPERQQAAVREGLIAIGEEKLGSVLAAAGETTSAVLRRLLDMVFFPYWTQPQAKTCFSLSRRDPSDLKQVLDLLRNGLFAKAIPNLQVLARAHPQDPFYLALLARSLEDSGDPEQAVSTWKQTANLAAREPCVAEWAQRQVERIRQVQEGTRQTLASTDFAAMPVEKLNELLERNPAEVLSKMVVVEGSRKLFSAALAKCPASRVSSWNALFPDGQSDPRWRLLQSLTSPQRSRWVKLALLASVGGVASFLALGASSIWRIGIQDEPWLVNPTFLFAALGALCLSIGAWNKAVTWDGLFRAVMSGARGGTPRRSLVTPGAVLYAVALVASLVLAIVVGTVYPPPRPETYTFDRWGISFSYPSGWDSFTDPEVEALKHASENQLAPFGRTLQELKAFRSQGGELALFVSKLKTNTPLSPSGVLQERQGVLEAAQRAGDVTKVNLLEQTQIGAGATAVVEDLERSNGGRGRSLKVVSGHFLFEVSFVVSDKALYPKYSAAIDKLAASLKVEPQE